MTRIQECLAYNIKKYRKLRNLTQEQLGALAGTSTNYIGTIEIGKRFPSPAMIEKIANAFKIESPLLFQLDSIHLLDETYGQTIAFQKNTLKKAVLKHLTNAVEEAFEEK